MNRDKIAQSQPETRQETRAFLHWHPQVFIDQHGQPDTYFFPPNSLPQNRQVDRARINKWTDIFGRANAAAFDRRGWQYVTRETFDLFYPGYLDSFTTLSGAIGMTYETDGGGNLARRRDDQTVSTLRDGAAHHLETALASIVAAAQNRESLLRDFLAYHRAALVPEPSEKMRRIVLLPGSDPGRLAELAALLLRVGVETREVRTTFTSDTAHAYMPEKPSADPQIRNPRHASFTAQRASFPAGSLVIDLAQPQGRVARAFLEPDPDFEAPFVREQEARRERNEKRNPNERREEYEFYDITAWALPYAYNVKAYWTEDTIPIDAKPLALDTQEHVALAGATRGIHGGKASVAYLFRYDRDASAFLALRLLQDGVRLAYLRKPLHLNGQEWPRGTLVALAGRNDDTLYARLERLAAASGVDITAINSGYGDNDMPGLGSESLVSLWRPRVALVSDDNVSITSYGAMWHLFATQAGLAFTPVRLRALQSENLSRFNVIVMPDGYNYAGVLGKGGMEALREWVGRGNTLIGVGGGGLWFTDKVAQLSSAVPVGQEEEPAATGQNAPAATPAPPTPAGVKPKPKKPIDLAGAIFRAHIDPTHFLGYGYPEGEIAVPLAGACSSSRASRARTSSLSTRGHLACPVTPGRTTPKPSSPTPVM